MSVYRRAVVTGGRKFRDLESKLWILNDLSACVDAGCQRLAEGGAVGADAAARTAWHTLAAKHASGGDGAGGPVLLESETYKPDFALDGPWPEAGCVRNVRMLDAEVALARTAGEHAPVGLAYPDPESRGTWHCVREMLRRGMTVMVHAPHYPGEIGVAMYTRLHRLGMVACTQVDADRGRWLLTAGWLRTPSGYVRELAAILSTN